MSHYNDLGIKRTARKPLSVVYLMLPVTCLPLSVPLFHARLLHAKKKVVIEPSSGQRLIRLSTIS